MIDESKKDNFYVNANSIIDRMVKAYGKSQTKFANDILKISGTNLSKARRDRKIPEKWFDLVFDKFSLTKNELCGLIRIDYEEDGTSSHEIALDERSIEELLNDTQVVLESDTVYRQALASNIRAFKQAVINEGKMKNTDEKIDQMMRQIETLTNLVLQGQSEPEKKRAGNAD